MAIFHASVKTFSRGRGQSAVAAAAYRAGVQLHDELGGKTQDYRSRSGVLASFIVLPNNAPSWMADRAMLWNMAEAGGGLHLRDLGKSLFCLTKAGT